MKFYGKYHYMKIINFNHFFQSRVLIRKNVTGSTIMLLDEYRNLDSNVNW